MRLNKAIISNSKHIADLLFHKSNRKNIFADIEKSQQPVVFRSLTKHVQKDVATHMDEVDLTRLVESLDPDEATDVLQLVSKTRSQKILTNLSDSLKDALSTLLEFDAQTAAGLMTLDYIHIDKNSKVIDVIERFKLHEQKTGRAPVVLVEHEGELKGYVPAYQLVLLRHQDKIAKVIQPIPTVSYTASHDEVVAVFQKHPHSRVVVMNDANNVVGIIYSDDVLRMLQEQEAASLYDFAGISSEESVSDSALKKIQFRYRWLIINLATAFLAAYVVSLFEDTLSAFVLLAVYMPIVAGMGGNAATQTLAVMVRGISRRQITMQSSVKALKREVLAALGNGVINGVLVSVVVYAINQNILLSAVLGVAMVANLVVAAFFGTLIPLVLARLGKDPAASATVLITTATDVLGFVIFLGLGTWLLV